MASTVMVVGECGTGKTTSLRTLDPKETLIISTIGKDLSFRGWKKKYTPLIKNKEGEWSGNYYISYNYENILKILKLVNLKMTHIKQVVIDDFQYMMSFEMLDRAKETGFTKFTELAEHVRRIFLYAKDIREDCTVVYLTHSENEGTDTNPKYVMKTAGKMLRQQLTIEGMFTVMFFTKVIDKGNEVYEYKFLTNTDGECVARSSMGMFELYIDNDMQFVIDTIRKYNDDDTEPIETKE